MPMTTLTATEARTNLSTILRRAIAGEEIGIISGGKIVVLRPTQIVSTDYVESEYHLAPADWDKVTKNLDAKGKQARAKGKAKRFTGNIEDALRG